MHQSGIRDLFILWIAREGGDKGYREEVFVCRFQTKEKLKMLLVVE
jgi:hypothetical protein